MVSSAPSPEPDSQSVAIDVQMNELDEWMDG